MITKILLFFFRPPKTAFSRPVFKQRLSFRESIRISPVMKPTTYLPSLHSWADSEKNKLGTAYPTPLENRCPIPCLRTITPPATLASAVANLLAPPPSACARLSSKSPRANKFQPASAMPSNDSGTTNGDSMRLMISCLYRTYDGAEQ